MRDGIFVSFDKNDTHIQFISILSNTVSQDKITTKEITEVETSMKELEGKLETLRVKLNELKK